MRVCATIALLLLLSACSEHKKDADSRKVFRYNEATGIATLDPAFANDQAKIWACNHLFNGLVQLDKQLIPQPCIAKSWEISGDGTVYTFHLRNDVRFHQDALLSGTRKVKASDFIYSFQRVMDASTASPGAWVFRNTAVKNGMPAFEAPDDTTFIITLNHAFPPFLGLLSMPYCSVVPFEVVKHYGRDFRTHPVGTGPFRFKMWMERSALVLHKNEQYFEKDSNGNRLPYLDAVMVSFINDKQSAFLEFLKGRLDFISGLDASYKDDLLTRNGVLRSKYEGRFNMLTSPYLNTEYLGFLMEGPLADASPLKDKRIRQAINYGFDRRKMIAYMRNGMATPGTSGFVPAGLPSFDADAVKGYDYDPVKAAQLLADAGYPHGKGLPEIVMSTTAAYQDLCEFMQGQLAEIGIRIKIDLNQAAQHRQMVAKQQLLFFRGSWIGDYADAENYLSLFYSPNFAPDGPNYTHFKNEKFDELYRQAMTITDDSLRYIIYREMDNLIMEEAPVVVLYYDKVIRLSGNNVHGLDINAINLLDLKRVRKD
jgi:oligopeptide transport system substrate-binding protein